MKPNRLLIGITLASVVLLALHISQDIVFGFDPAGLNQLIGVGILLVITTGAVMLPNRRLGQVIMLLGGVVAAGMLPIHMRNGMRAEILEMRGALLFVWTMYVLGVMGFLAIILAVRALMTRPSAGA